jgi:septum formation protein
VISKDLILASTSPRRRFLLEEAGLAFRVIAPEVEELEPGLHRPEELCALNAARKAGAVAMLHPAATVIGADTIVVLGDTIFGKPKDLAHAAEMLTALAGRSHHVLTGVCLIRKSNNLARTWVETTRVDFHPITFINIPDYLARINPLDKAGGYSAQEDNGQLLAGIEGCYQNVIGLPVPALVKALKSFS